MMKMHLVAGALGLALLEAACGARVNAPQRAVVYAEATPSLAQQILATLPEEPTRVAILPLESDGDVAGAVGRLLLDELSVTLARRPSITLAERQKLKAVLQELAIQSTFGADDEVQAAIASAIGARFLITARATKLGDSVKIVARILDTTNSSVVGGAELAVIYDDLLREAIADRNARANLRTSREVLAALDRVHAGELEAAEELFVSLSNEQEERRSVGLMGRAAVALARGQKKPAKEMCETSRTLSDAPSYCWVLEGRIAYEQGALPEARAFFTRALNDESTLTGWQRAQAANGLGLIAASEGEVGVAGQLYARAVELDPSNSEALSNQAQVLERAGDLDAAIALYQRGLKADPDDRVLALLLRDAEMRATLARDRARQEAIAKTAARLVSTASAGGDSDGWSTLPLTVSVMPLEEKGAPATRLGETAFLEGSLRSGLEASKGVQLVDRALLGSVLNELELSSAALTDESTALRVGKIMSARVLIGGTLVRLGDEAQVTLKLVDTETTRILKSVNLIFDVDDRASQKAEALRRALATALNQAVPLRTRVTGNQRGRAELPVGSTAGVAVGDVFTLSSPDGRTTLGEAAVVEVTPTSAWLEAPRRAPKNARAELRRSPPI